VVNCFIDAIKTVNRRGEGRRKFDEIGAILTAKAKNDIDCVDRR
jgi:hypothetical protein